MLARTTVSAFGGISASTVPTPISGPRLMLLLYPFLSMSGRRMVPRRAHVAIVEPLRAPIITPMMMARMESLPLILPSHLSSTLTASRPRPEWKIISPMKMKKGTGSRVKVLAELNAPVTTPTMPGIPPRKNQAAIMLTTRREKAMGRPVSNTKTMPPKSTRMIVYHSMTYLAALSSANLLHAILKNWTVSKKLPSGMMKKISAFGTVTALTSVT